MPALQKGEEPFIDSSPFGNKESRADKVKAMIDRKVVQTRKEPRSQHRNVGNEELTFKKPHFSYE